MSDTLSNILLPKGVWVDLYASSGIAVGTKISVENLGYSTVQLVASATEPSANPAGFNRLHSVQTKSNQTGDSGAWARSVSIDGVVNVGDI